MLSFIPQSRSGSRTLYEFWEICAFVEGGAEEIRDIHRDEMWENYFRLQEFSDSWIPSPTWYPSDPFPRLYGSAASLKETNFISCKRFLVIQIKAFDCKAAQELVMLNPHASTREINGSNNSRNCAICCSSPESDRQKHVRVLRWKPFDASR